MSKKGTGARRSICLLDNAATAGRSDAGGEQRRGHAIAFAGGDCGAVEGDGHRPRGGVRQPIELGSAWH